MTEQRLADAWPHIRRAVEILLYGSESEPQTHPQATETETPKSGVRVSSDKIPGGVRWGTYSRIAHELGVTPQHVRLVALGRATSQRVLDRLNREWEAERGA